MTGAVRAQASAHPVTASFPDLNQGRLDLQSNALPTELQRSDAFGCVWQND